MVHRVGEKDNNKEGHGGRQNKGDQESEREQKSVMRRRGDGKENNMLSSLFFALQKDQEKGER